MAKHAELRYVEIVSKQDLLKFKEEFNKDIIKNGLDKPIKESLSELKETLSLTINEQVRVREPAKDQTVIVNRLGQESFNPSKSETEILKYLTNGKTSLEKYDSAKDWNTLNDAGVLFGFANRQGGEANRVGLRIDISDTDTVESQYSKARDFFNKAIIALPDSSGRLRYYVNPGIDLTQYVKIKCSTQTGFGDEVPEKGMSPKARFEKDKEKPGNSRYATWTLKQEALSVVRNRFIDLTPAVDFIKQGNFQKANDYLNAKDSDNKIIRIKNQVDDLVNNKATGPIKNYTDIIKLVNSLKLVKKLEKHVTIYTLVYTDGDTENKAQKDTVIRTIRAWVTDKELSWFKSLVEKVEELIDRFERK